MRRSAVGLSGRGYVAGARRSPARREPHTAHVACTLRRIRRCALPRPLALPPGLPGGGVELPGLGERGGDFSEFDVEPL